MATINTKQVWRPIVKVIGVLEAIRVAAELVICVALIVGGSVWGAIEVNKFLYDDKNIETSFNIRDYVTPSPDDFYKDFVKTSTKVLVWVSLVITLVFCVIEIFAVWGLLEACELSCDPLDASLNASVWKYTKIILFVISIKGYTNILQWGPLGLKILVGTKIIMTVVGLIIVHMFISEQDSIVASQTDVNANTDLASVDVHQE